MDTVIVAEVLERSHKVRERMRLAEFPVGIGRAYDNDVILDDPFVSPHHARIERDADGTLVLVDLDSTNGTLALPSHTALRRVPLGDEQMVQMGHTLLRLRRAAAAVPPARPDSLLRSRVAYALGNARLAIVLTLAMVAALLFDRYQSSVESLSVSRLAFDAAQIALLVPVWAGWWALLTRLFSHHTAYVPHLNIGCLAVLGFLCVDTASGYFAFAFSADLSADIVFHLVFALLAAAVLYAHLRFATLMAPRLGMAVSGSIATALIGFAAFSAYVDNLEYSDALPYPPELKPGGFRLAPTVSLDEFAERAERMAARVDRNSN